MRIMKAKEAIILLLVMGIMVIISGCARWPDGPGPGPGEPEYQLKITVEVAGAMNPDEGEGIYYIVLDADGNSVDGPGDDILFWEDEYYYIQLDEWDFYFTRVEEGSPSISLTDSSYSENKLQVTISLGDLEDPQNSIDFNVITTDSDNNTYDYLDNYLTISTALGSTVEDIDFQDDLEEGGADFDIVKVTAEIATLY